VAGVGENQTTTYYVDGEYRTGRQWRKIVDPGELALYARQATPRIAPGFIVGMCERETNRDEQGACSNQRDYDVDKDHYTYGCAQCDRADAIKARSSAALSIENLFDPAENIAVLASVLEDYFDEICDAADVDPDAPPLDVYAYMCWAHNQGLSAALKGIRTYGLDWAGMKARNQAAIDAAGGLTAAAQQIKSGSASGGVKGSYYVVARLAPYADYVLQRIADYPGGTSGGDEGGGEAETGGEVDTPVGKFTRAESQKFLVNAAFAIVLAAIAWPLLRRILR
jgi:hypothetical protein